MYCFTSLPGEYVLNEKKAILKVQRSQLSPKIQLLILVVSHQLKDNQIWLNSWMSLFIISIMAFTVIAREYLLLARLGKYMVILESSK